MDTCSGGELAVAARAGIEGPNLGLHGNNKSDAEIKRALDMKVGRIVVDSLDELERVAKIASSRGETAKVMLRLTPPGVHAHTHEFIATAHEDQKFGLSMAGDTTDEAGLSAAEEAVAAATSYASIELLGLHCHIGSQIFEPDGFALAAEKLLASWPPCRPSTPSSCPNWIWRRLRNRLHSGGYTPAASRNCAGDGRRRAFQVRGTGHHSTAYLD